MLTSLTEKFRSYIFPSSKEGNFETPSRKRKRTVDETESRTEDPDVEIVSVKRPRNVLDIVTAPINTMANWMRQKTSFSRDYFFKPLEDQPTLGVPPDTSYHRSYPNLPNANGRNWNTDPHGIQKTVPSSRPSTFPPQKAKRSFRDVVAPPIHSNGHTDENVQASKKPSISKDQSIFTKGFNGSTVMGNQCTAQLCVRLDEKEKYRQLLQQFTTVPLDSSQQRKRTPPKLSLFKNASTNRSQNSSFFNKSSREEPTLNNSFKKRPKSQRVIAQAVDPLNVSSSYLTKHHKVAVDLLSSAPSLHVINISRHRTVESPSKQEDTTCSNTERISSPALKSEKSFTSLSSPTFEKLEESIYMKNAWFNDLKRSHDLDKQERDRKINEAELTLQTLTELRRRRYDEMEKNLREQMRALEPFTQDIREGKEVRKIETEKETKLVELTPEMNKVIDDAIGPGSLRTVVSEGFKIQITKEDIQTLKGLNWLNDEVINFYMNMLMERGDEDNMARVHAFNTFFYPKLAGSGHSVVRRWTKRVDVLNVDYILVPVHLGVHWCLAIIDFIKKSIRYYDSMGGNNDTCLNALKQYLIDECLDKKKQKFDLTGWSTVAVKDIPQQMNGSDCGMFSCVFAEYVTRGAKITFTQDDMPYFRRKMVYEIVTKKLLQR
ncbi:sentrin-specific protease 1 isoform X2 [Patella vulgata]|uniref:sentrin-specific protease 1 isoform X2 n=1 Tax=Patella vulgata TaxID=6465 RepID=UPI00217FA602|nr:sentrin-specific protease 1 isoform X2 [Patella vulgata]